MSRTAGAKAEQFAAHCELHAEVSAATFGRPTFSMNRTDSDRT